MSSKSNITISSTSSSDSDITEEIEEWELIENEDILKTL
jgi:hypothetical protein